MYPVSMVHVLEHPSLIRVSPSSHSSASQRLLTYPSPQKGNSKTPEKTNSFTVPVEKVEEMFIPNDPPIVLTNESNPDAGFGRKLPTTLFGLVLVSELVARLSM